MWTGRWLQGVVISQERKYICAWQSVCGRGSVAAQPLKFFADVGSLSFSLVIAPPAPDRLLWNSRHCVWAHVTARPVACVMFSQLLQTLWMLRRWWFKSPEAAGRSTNTEFGGGNLTHSFIRTVLHQDSPPHREDSWTEGWGWGSSFGSRTCKTLKVNLFSII